MWCGKEKPENQKTFRLHWPFAEFLTGACPICQQRGTPKIDGVLREIRLFAYTLLDNAFELDGCLGHAVNLHLIPYWFPVIDRR